MARELTCAAYDERREHPQRTGPHSRIAGRRQYSIVADWRDLVLSLIGELDPDLTGILATVEVKQQDDRYFINGWLVHFPEEIAYLVGITPAVAEWRRSHERRWGRISAITFHRIRSAWCQARRAGRSPHEALEELRTLPTRRLRGAPWRRSSLCRAISAFCDGIEAALPENLPAVSGNRSDDDEVALVRALLPDVKRLLKLWEPVLALRVVAENDDEEISSLLHEAIIAATPTGDKPRRAYAPGRRALAQAIAALCLAMETRTLRRYVDQARREASEMELFAFTDSNAAVEPETDYEPNVAAEPDRVDNDTLRLAENLAKTHGVSVADLLDMLVLDFAKRSVSRRQQLVTTWCSSMVKSRGAPAVF